LAWNSIHNRYLVVWMSSPDWSTRLHGVYRRRIGADGARIGPSSASAIGEPPTTSCIYMPPFGPDTRRDLVVWTDARHPHDEIYGRQLAASGAFVIGDDVYHDLAHAIANPGSSEILVVWMME
jgi:hypothetical protein